MDIAKAKINKNEPQVYIQGIYHRDKKFTEYFS